jgi:predicted aldo/keto reductase-like oxidoreductase
MTSQGNSNMDGKVSLSQSNAAAGMSRREFVKVVAATSVAVGASTDVLGQTQDGNMIYRTLGKTGEKISAIGLGGYHIGVPKDENESIRIIRSAVDRGITFMDNCWDYHDGGSETRMGKALRDGYRDKVFLMSKIDGRTKALAAKQIDESLKRLQTDRLDLMQHHEIIRVEDPDRIFSDGGAHEALVEAQKAGKVRYIGFTGHKDPFIHLRTLEVAAQKGIRFDAVQFPLNVMDAHFRSFEKQVLPVLVKDNVGVIGMKSLGSGAIVKTKAVSPIECLHYALNLPTSVVVTGMETMARLDQALEAVRTFKPMKTEQVAALLARTKDLAMTGKHEGFKTTPQFDATARHPDWTG